MTTPTPGDLSARLLAESQRRESEWAHTPTNNPRSKFVHDERLRELLREAAAALSALPSAGDEVAWPTEAKRAGDDWQARTALSTHTMGEAQAAVWNACRAACIAAHKRAATTPQPSAAEELGPHPLNICPKCKDYYMDCECPPDAAVGAQGDGDDNAARIYIRDWCPDHVKDYIARLAAPAAHRDFIEEVNPAGDRTGYFLFAPAAGKGVDAFELVRGRLPAPIRTNHAAWPTNYAEGFNDAIRIVEEELPEALDALTRQPVAGDGMVLVPREPTHEMELALSDALASGDYSIGDCLQRAIAAAPAATPTDGGEG